MGGSMSFWHNPACLRKTSQPFSPENLTTEDTEEAKPLSRGLTQMNADKNNKQGF
jgi:hypothetical protein